MLLKSQEVDDAPVASHPPGVSRATSAAVANRLSIAMGACAVLAYFLTQAWPGLFVDFQHDDVMNLHAGWSVSLPRLLWAVIWPLTTVARPAGNLLYVVEYKLFGWDPFGYRVVAYGLLFLNALLVWRLAALLARSHEVGLISALLFCFHPKMQGLYINNGTTYDPLAMIFYLGALCFYIEARQRTGVLSRWRVFAIVACFVLGINAKEYVASLPFVLGAWELVYFRPAGSLRSAAVRWALPAALAVAAVLAIHAKTAEGTGLAANSMYHPVFTARQFLINLRYEASTLFGLPDLTLNTAKTIAVHAMLLGCALVFRRRFFVFLFLYVLLAPVPLLFIPWRGLFAFYVALAGWSIGLSALIVAGRDWLLEHVWRRSIPTDHLWEYERVAMFGLLVWVLLGNWKMPESEFRGPHYGNAEIRGDINDYQRLKLPLPQGGSLLLLNDRSGTETWTPFFVARLFHGDRDLIVDRVKMNQRQPGKTYDVVLDLRDGHFVRVH